MGDLDPEDWDDFRARAHDVLDQAIDHLKAADQGPVWEPVPEAIQAKFAGPLPENSSDVVDGMLELLPHGVGNIHPRFFGWVHGAGSPEGLYADMITSAMNVNSGGRNHASAVVELQVIDWMLEMVGFSKDGSGILVSGTSLATVIALKVARDQALATAQSNGSKTAKLVGYCSAQTHSCIRRAFDLLGLGSDHLRVIECDEAFQISVPALERQIIKDKNDGFVPFLVVGTAGAVNMGAFDDLSALASIACQNSCWYHIDAAFGIGAKLSNTHQHLTKGMDQANSIAFDFHKWFQVNYDAGIVLFQDEAAHRTSFMDRPDYLRTAERGLAGGAFWGVDYGPELSREFRALKVWAHLKGHGLRKLGKSIDRNIELAGYLAKKIAKEDRLEALAPVPLNINCFRYAKGRDLNRLNEELVIRLQEDGVVVPSTTLLDGQLAIRVNITNHRTQQTDMDILIAEVLRIGDELAQANF